MPCQLSQSIPFVGFNFANSHYAVKQHLVFKRNMNCWARPDESCEQIDERGEKIKKIAANTLNSTRFEDKHAGEEEEEE